MNALTLNEIIAERNAAVARVDALESALATATGTMCGVADNLDSIDEMLPVGLAGHLVRLGARQLRDRADATRAVYRTHTTEAA